jgi:hypothetical protein
MPATSQIHPMARQNTKAVATLKGEVCFFWAARLICGEAYINGMMDAGERRSVARNSVMAVT